MDAKCALRKDFPYRHVISTRWHDNDAYGHVNNVVYYSFFDTAVNHFLIKQCGLDIASDPVVAYVVSSSAHYFSPLAYPQEVEVGVQLKRLGRSSVTYRLGVFVAGEDAVKAAGEFVHVFVRRDSGSSVSIPAAIRQQLESLLSD